ncbi:3-phosphoshikimate 1-carboxyvinyltransferase [Actinomyces oris]|uniref:3-phosphoshikimate 1-carboxyvinyltransferase n=1 Tax=Actinomyces oris TaxID=544580 RepID=A0AAW9KLN6_9ACTO|nr:3-phosphoshikimate 1-carboxyvinyltransferase [Actinomyces oris]MEA1305995.1 3-phosphoshikimate 1-carboxyvinyltransferase [Actinomyces oris]OLO62126.1 3-phosphoshikimate 1-carboxyvinyltransferase [Actinomyces oris]
MTDAPDAGDPGVPAALSTGSAEPWRAPVAEGALEAVVELPGSKSLSARALLLAAIADAPTTLTGLLRSRDTELMLAALTGLGARFEDLDETGTRLRVTPAPLPLHVQTGPDGVGRIDVGLAGTVMRFVPALAALADAPVVFDGDEAARRRPMAPLLDALADLGAEVTHLGEPGFLPFRVGPGGGAFLRAEGARVAVDGSASSQFVSALLLLGAILPGGLEVTPTGPVPSLTHVAMTVATLRERGIAVDEPAPGAGDGERTWRVHPGRPLGGQVAIEPDLSNAGPFLAAALVAGGRVSVPHWPAATTQAGDAWRELLPRLGGEVTLIDGTLTARGTGRLTGIHADLSDVGELAPTVAALATLAGAQGHTSALTGIAHLRGHETDRLAALAAQIRLLGGDAEESDDGLIIRPAPLHGAALRSYADHRMATFAAIIGLSVEGVSLDDVECTSKTLPGFTDLWAAMLATATAATTAGQGGTGVAAGSSRGPVTPGDGA